MAKVFVSQAHETWSLGSRACDVVSVAQKIRKASGMSDAIRKKAFTGYNKSLSYDGDDDHIQQKIR